jgi:hypothetical protein
MFQDLKILKFWNLYINSNWNEFIWTNWMKECWYCNLVYYNIRLGNKFIVFNYKCNLTFRITFAHLSSTNRTRTQIWSVFKTNNWRMWKLPHTRHIWNKTHSFYFLFWRGEEKVSTWIIYTKGNKHAPSFIYKKG